MTKADIVNRIAQATGLTKVETEAVVNGMISTSNGIKRVEYTFVLFVKPLLNIR